MGTSAHGAVAPVKNHGQCGWLSLPRAPSKVLSYRYQRLVADNSYDPFSWSEATYLLTLPVRLDSLSCQSRTDGGLLCALLVKDHQVLEPCER